MQIFSVTSQLYYLIKQLHVSATAISRRNADPKNKKRKKEYSFDIGQRSLNWEHLHFWFVINTTEMIYI
jgi:hypothetical protein